LPLSLTPPPLQLRQQLLEILIGAERLQVAGLFAAPTGGPLKPGFSYCFPISFMCEGEMSDHSIPTHSQTARRRELQQRHKVSDLVIKLFELVSGRPQAQNEKQDHSEHSRKFNCALSAFLGQKPFAYRVGKSC